MDFSDLGLIEPLLRSVAELGYTKPSPIQVKAIPAILKRHDVLASAQTGTGKTAGFALPILQNLSNQTRAKQGSAKVLILTPTRELAAQVHDSVKEYGRYLNLRSAVVFGGVKINPQIAQLRSGVEILVATPGRLMDLHNQRAIQLNEIDTFVLDEADRMLDMGFIYDIKRIIKLLPPKRQNLLFSATFSNEIRNLVKSILNNPVEIDVSLRNTPIAAVTQSFNRVEKSQKTQLLIHLLRENCWMQVLVFSRTKHGANRLVEQLSKAKIQSGAIHGNKSQSHRTKILESFKMGEIRVLVATDIAARGIDIEDLPCVINYDLPNVPEDYVHRVGRTGRAGAFGVAISFVSPEEAPYLRDIEKLLARKLDQTTVMGFKPQENQSSSVTVTKNGQLNRKKIFTRR